MHRLWLAWFVAMTCSAPLGAQSAPDRAAPGGSVEADPIRCWWRTSTGAVRVGEPFSLVLTCAVVENETTTVVPDQSRLEPAAMQLPPFEVIGGQRSPDLRSDQRRFFQYQYTLRLISSELFGRDARIPSLQVGYHLESRVQRGDSVRGRDRTYILPTQAVRILSLVPSDAADIRDAPRWTFDDIETQRFRARVFFVAAGLLFAVGALIVLVALVRMVRRAREGGSAGRRVLSDSVILRYVGRELSAVQRLSEREGWNLGHVSRALAAFRVAGTIALEGRAGQIAAPARSDAHDGQLLMRGGWLRGKKVFVSGSATSAALDRALSKDSEGSPRHRQALATLQTALGLFTAALFGREQKLDDATLGQALTESFTALRRLRTEHLWLMRKLKGLTAFAGELGDRAWSR